MTQDKQSDQHNRKWFTVTLKQKQNNKLTCNGGLSFIQSIMMIMIMAIEWTAIGHIIKHDYYDNDDQQLINRNPEWI